MRVNCASSYTFYCVSLHLCQVHGNLVDAHKLTQSLFYVLAFCFILYLKYLKPVT